MCLGVPGKVQQIYEANGALMGKVNFGGIVKDVCLAYLPDIQVGDYTIVHVGFAIAKIDEASAQETLHTFAEMGLLDEELNPDAHVNNAGPIECAVDPFDIRNRQKPS